MFFIAAAVAITAIARASAQDPNAAPTPAPGYDYAYTQEMPYDWMTSEGYKSVDCGYGYNKDESQHCTKADWVRRNPPTSASAAHYLHSAFLCNSMITRAAMQQRSSSKFRSPFLFLSPAPQSHARAHLRHSHNHSLYETTRQCHTMRAHPRVGPILPIAGTDSPSTGTVRHTPKELTKTPQFHSPKPVISLTQPPSIYQYGQLGATSRISLGYHLFALLTLSLPA